MDNKNRRTVILSDESIEMLNKLKIKVGHATDSEVLRTAVFTYHSKIFKDYIDIKNLTGAGTEELAERKLKIEETKEKMRLKKEEDRVMNIVKQLDGKIEMRKDGERVCKYVVHQLRADYPQEILLRNMTEDLIKYQWVPDQKTVEKFRSKNK